MTPCPRASRPSTSCVLCARPLSRGSQASSFPLPVIFYEGHCASRVPPHQWDWAGIALLVDVGATADGMPPVLVGSYRLRALPIDRELAYGVRRNVVLQKLTSYPLATFVCDDKQHHKLMAVDVHESPEALRLLLCYDEAQCALEGKRYVCQNSPDPKPGRNS